MTIDDMQNQQARATENMGTVGMVTQTPEIPEEQTKGKRRLRILQLQAQEQQPYHIRRHQYIKQHTMGELCQHQGGRSQQQ